VLRGIKRQKNPIFLQKGEGKMKPSAKFCLSAPEITVHSPLHKASHHFVRKVREEGLRRTKSRGGGEGRAGSAATFTLISEINHVGSQRVATPSFDV